MSGRSFPSERFDLVVLGSGPGGEKGAAQAAYFGKRVALVERAPEVGGASVHTGTLPSKTLRETALYLTGFRRRELYGMKLRLDRKKSLRQLVGRLRDVEERQTRQVRRNLDRHGIVLVTGSASFEDARTVVVRDAQERISRRLTAEAFLVATGSSPMAPRGIDMSDPDVVDSDRILDLDRVPSSMTVVGGGVIGTEYACLFAALGTRITLVEGRERLLAGIDEELSSTIQLSLERMGSEIMLGDAVVSLERVAAKSGNALRLRLKSGRRLRADKVLFSSGRAGNTRGLNLEAIGVGVTERGHIPVNEHFQTSVPHIYAVGDVIGFPGLASTSMEQGRVATCHAFGIAYKKGLASLLPLGIYSIPEMSSVGASEQELQQKGVRYEIGRARFENNARGQITGESEGVLKLLFDPATRKILGAHILGEHATELIHVPMFVMAGGGTIDAFIDAVFNFPTLAESFKYAAYDGLQRLAQAEARWQRSVRDNPRGDPATRHWFLGMAFAGEPVTGQPLAVCEMDRWRRCRFMTWSYDPKGDGLIPEELEREGFVFGIGARNAPKALLESLRGRGHGLLPDAGPRETEIVRVSCEAFWSVWSGGGRRTRGRQDSVRRRRYEMLRARGLEFSVGEAAIHDDQLETAAAAYAGYLWATGQARVEGGAVVPAEGGRVK